MDLSVSDGVANKLAGHPVLLLSTFGAWLEVLYESLVDENCASAQEIGEKCAHRGAHSWPEFEMFRFPEISVLMGLSLSAQQLFLERIDGHETQTIRQIRASSFRKNTESQN